MIVFFLFPLSVCRLVLHDTFDFVWNGYLLICLPSEPLSYYSAIEFLFIKIITMLLLFFHGLMGRILKTYFQGPCFQICILNWFYILVFHLH